MVLRTVKASFTLAAALILFILSQLVVVSRKSCFLTLEVVLEAVRLSAEVGVDLKIPIS